MHLTGEATLRSIKLVTFLFMFPLALSLNDSFVLYNSLKDVPLLLFGDILVNLLQFPFRR